MKYKLTIAEQYLCVPACLSMIIKAKCKEEYSQYEIADYFGVNIPNDEHIANVRNVFYTNDTNNIGVVIKDNEVNEFFNAFSIPLIETYRSAYQIHPDDFTSLLKKELLKNNSIICAYSYGGLYGYDSIEVGHVSIILDVSDDLSTVTILDPGPDDYGMKEVNADRLLLAMRMKKNGLWIISSK